MKPRTDQRSETRAFTLTNVFAQTSLIIAVPLVTRFMDQDEFGRYQVVLALSTILQAVLTGGIEYLVPAVHERDLPKTMRRAAIICLAAVISISALAVVLMMTTDTSIGIGLLAALAVALVYAVAALDTAWRGRFGMLRYLARRNAIFGLGVIALQVTACLFWPTVWGLVLAVVISRVVSVLMTQKRPPMSPLASGTDAGASDRDGLSQNFAWVLAIVLSNIALQLPVLILGTQSLDVAGQVGLAIRLVGLPSAIIGAAVGQTFSFKIGKLLREGASRTQARTVVSRTQIKWGTAGAALAIAFMVLAPISVTPLLGSGWQPVGTYIAILALPFGLQMATRIVTPGYAALGRSWVLCWLQLARIGIVTASLAAPLMRDFGTTSAVVLLAVASGMYFVAFGVVTTRTIVRSWPELAAPGSVADQLAVHNNGLKVHKNSQSASRLPTDNSHR